MKQIFLLIFIICISSSFAQESFSFSVAQPLEEKSVYTVDPLFFGIYSSPTSDTYYEFNSEGVWAISTIYSSILKETIRESSKYTVRNGYLFGILENDSIPCVLNEDRYHFGVKHKEQIIGLHSKHILKKISATNYMINFFENDSYTPSQFIFKDQTLEVKHFDYEINTKLFEAIKIQTSKKDISMNYITLTPSTKEWHQIQKAGIFGKGNLFLKM
ncbi:MAG: hypothetical protein HYR91_10085 [Flavobacteriia bacterium]|nr:hypothetical protein [Flavobacteriia bacterium]